MIISIHQRGLGSISFNEEGSINFGAFSIILEYLTVTTDSQIKVKFVENLPNSSVIDINAVHLAMDDGAGGEFITVIGAD